MKKLTKKSKKQTVTQEALVDTFRLRTALYLACLKLSGGDMDAACETAEYLYDHAPELLEKMNEATPAAAELKPENADPGTLGKLLKFRRKPDLERKDLAECFSLFAEGVDNGRLHSVFAVAITATGAVPVVLVEPEDREPLMTAMNAELSRMFGSPHHVISDEDLDEFLRQHNITAMDVLRFKKAQSQS